MRSRTGSERTASSNVMEVLWGLGELGIPSERIDIGGAFSKSDTSERWRTGAVACIRPVGTSHSRAGECLLVLMPRYIGQSCISLLVESPPTGPFEVNSTRVIRLSPRSNCTAGSKPVTLAAREVVSFRPTLAGPLLLIYVVPY
jgi:hypothetical protein